MKKLAALIIFIFSLTFILPSAPSLVVIQVVRGPAHQDEQSDCLPPGSVHFTSDPVRPGTTEFREEMEYARAIARAKHDCNAHIQIDFLRE